MLYRENRSRDSRIKSRDTVRESYTEGLSAILWSQGISWLDFEGFISFSNIRRLYRATNSRGD